MEQPFFKYRVNDKFFDVSNGLRKTTIVACEGLQNQTGVVPCSVTTMAIEIPMKVDCLLNTTPYLILNTEVCAGPMCHHPSSPKPPLPRSASTTRRCHPAPGND